MQGGSLEKQVVGDDVEEEEDDEEKPVLQVGLGERLERNPLTQATMDIWEEAWMTMLISCAAVPAADGEPLSATRLECVAIDGQRLFRLLAVSSRGE